LAALDLNRKNPLIILLMNKRGQKYEEKTIESELRKEKELALKSKDI